MQSQKSKALYIPLTEIVSVAESLFADDWNCGVISSNQKSLCKNHGLYIHRAKNINSAFDDVFELDVIFKMDPFEFLPAL